MSAAWEAVAANTYRLRVEGGWLYRVEIRSALADFYGDHLVIREHVVFVPEQPRPGGE